MNILDIPKEILCIVFESMSHIVCDTTSLIPYKISDIYKFSLICKLFNEISNNDIFWRNAIYNKYAIYKKNVIEEYTMSEPYYKNKCKILMRYLNFTYMCTKAVDLINNLPVINVSIDFKGHLIINYAISNYISWAVKFTYNSTNIYKILNNQYYSQYITNSDRVKHEYKFLCTLARTSESQDTHINVIKSHISDIYREISDIYVKKIAYHYSLYACYNIVSIDGRVIEFLFADKDNSITYQSLLYPTFINIPDIVKTVYISDIGNLALTQNNKIYFWSIVDDNGVLKRYEPFLIYNDENNSTNIKKVKNKSQTVFIEYHDKSVIEKDIYLLLCDTH